MGHFIAHATEFFLQVGGTWVDDGTDAEFRGAAQGLAAQILTGLQGGDGAQQPDTVHVKHSLGIRVVACRRGVAGHSQNVAHAQRVRRQQVGLKGNTIAVAAGDLHDRFNAPFCE